MHDLLKNNFEERQRATEEENPNLSPPKPLFISADLQDIHHPLRYPQTLNPRITTYFHPSYSRNQITQLYSGDIQITPENKAEGVLKLTNRLKNCLLTLDYTMGEWLDSVEQYLQDGSTILILTGDHGELLFDTDENLLWHDVNNAIDLQRQVPLFFHGPRDILSTLELPTENGSDNEQSNIVTCHSDLLPSLFEALAGQPLGDRWKQELDYHSYYNYRQNKNYAARAKGFAYNSFHKFHV